MQNIRLGLFSFLGFCASLLPAATTYNYWQAVDGDYNGRWGDAAHWSEGHVPTDGEFATIDPTRDAPSTVVAFSIEVDADYTADTLVVGDPNNVARKTSVTFTGSGSVTCSGTSGHLFRACTSITFDGPSFSLGGNGNVLNYTPLTVKNGSTLYLNWNLIFWKTNHRLTIDEGGTVSVRNLEFNNDQNNKNITVNAGGRFICRGQFVPYSGSDSSALVFGLVINGGDAQIGELKLTRAAAYVQMSAGSLYLVNGPTLCDVSQLRITGGKLRYGFDVLQDTSDPLYAIAQNYDWNGCRVFKATNDVTFTYHDTFYVSQLRISDSAHPARIDCDRIVFDGANNPFAFQYSGNRLMHLYGPTDLHVNGRDLSNGFNNHYINCHGRVTVHTEDWSDASVKRTVAIRGLGSADGTLDLVVTGGGTFKYGQVWSYETMRSFTVEAGTALILGNRDAKISNSTEWGPLVAERITLEKDVTVAFTAGEQHIAASTWSIDPSVRITVTIPETYTSQNVALTSGGFPVLQDLDSKSLPNGLLSQITLAGNSEGWSLVNENGQISVVKIDSSLLGTFGEFEWLGGSGANWSTTANWNGCTPAQFQAHVFGVSENRTVNFDSCGPAGGSTVGSIEFKESAGRSFQIGGNQTTFSASPSIKSSSCVPQVVATGFRWTGGSRQVASYYGGPIVLAASSRSWEVKGGYVGTFEYVGDVRTSNKLCSNVGSLSSGANRVQFPSHRTCFTVLDGGSMTFSKQVVEFSNDNSTLRVSKGGTLSFTGANGAIYSWARHPASIVVDGVLNVGPTLRGGYDQVYRGSGALNLNGGATPYRASSRVRVADALTVNLPSDWATSVSGSESLALALGASAGSPVLRVPTTWSYGVPAGVATTTTADARAFTLENGAVAYLDPQGGTATINETVSGEGTLAITNGTLVLNAATDSETVKVAACADSIVAIAANQRLAELSLAPGAKATVAAEVTLDQLSAAGAQIDLGSTQMLKMTGDVDVSGVDFVATTATGGWRTIVQAAGSITGTPANPRLAYRMVAESGRTLLQASKAGMMIFIK